MAGAYFARLRTFPLGSFKVTLKDDLIRDEGVRLKPYVDTKGKITISVGVNITDGISQAESDMLFASRLASTQLESIARMPWLDTAPEPVKRGVQNMLYNMGWPKLSQFVNMLAALKDKDYARAADEAMNSDWANQVGDRAQRIAKLFRSANG